ncbi:hypothetical protein FHS51_003162 [Sphingobium wenxiniae]|uniref:Uncharacterized protein n=1 Tax=Sphingobium wenxiniae (strain DSM 21828 / CGMCC 1.7748 / JZ-1) TaxID=595605 RepID=A0A562KJ81_SPHWJ|nr:hypothetical protein [Sphingobium wenxiniae]MBB6192908.1 hypothetical protein [Sphingobium wenxiniae]TWH95283.1 hypothetical protein IQ35_01539 [Sphingobium wenxiniae]
MKVRVFIPDPATRGDYLGYDFDFETMPQAGQFLRLTDDENPGDYPIDKIGFIQDREAFIASVWLKSPASPRAGMVKLGGI